MTTDSEKELGEDIPLPQGNVLCYVMSPLDESEEYKPGHFTRVYEDVIKPACVLAGFTAMRADRAKTSGLINLDVLQKSLEAPMAICDLSSRDPNVLFQLGFRLAFDKPTVLIQEAGKAKIFDIPTFKYVEYRRDLKYREVLEDQEAIAEALRAETAHSENGVRINSLTKMLSLSSLATLSDDSSLDTRKLLQLIHYEMNSMHSDIQRVLDYLPVERERQESPASRDEFRSIGDNIPLLQVEECYFKARKLHSTGADRKEVLQLLKLARTRLTAILQSETNINCLSKARDLLIKIAEFEKYIYSAREK